MQSDPKTPPKRTITKEEVLKLLDRMTFEVVNGELDRGLAEEIGKVLVAESARADQAEAATAAVVEMLVTTATARGYLRPDEIRALAPASGLAMLAELRARVEKAEAWRTEPESSDAWCAGNQYALDRLCKVLNVDPAKVSWDGSDGDLGEEADALIWRILRANDDEDGCSPIEADRDELRAAIFGSPDYAADLRNGNFREMAETLHSAQKGGIARAEKAEAERDGLAAANAVLEAKVAGLRAAFRVNMLRYGPPGTSHEEINAAIDAALASGKPGEAGE